MTKVWQKLTCNQSGAVRYDTMGGRSYRVAPVVMMLEGVLNANAGPILYKNADMAKFPSAWNNKPVVVYHPDDDMSACIPSIIDSQGIGVIMNTKMGEVIVDEVSKPALKAEAWVEIERATLVDNRVVDAIDSGTMMELSTGLFVEIENEEGEFEGKPYVGIAHNFQPDHLAILPDLKGACSMADGAGFIRNEEDNTLSLDTKGIDEGALKNFRNRMNFIVKNEISFDTTRSLLWSKLDETKTMAWIDEVFPSFFVYNDDGKLFKQGYLITDGVCDFVGEPVEVERVTEFRTKDGKLIGNRKGQSMDKSKVIDGLIANTSTPWVDGDRAVLMAMNDETLQRIANSATPIVEKPAAKPAEAEAAAEAAGTEQQQVTNAELSVDEYLETQVPAALRNTLKAAMNTERAMKEKLVATLIANKFNTFKPEFLKTKDVEELQHLVALANQGTGKEESAPESRFIDYAGQGHQEPVLNAETEGEALGLPDAVIASSD